MNPDRIRTIEIRVNLDHLADPEFAAAEVGNAVYKLAQLFFERGGEDNRRPDGSRVLVCNGHHVAQGLAETAQARWKQYEQPLPVVEAL